MNLHGALKSRSFLHLMTSGAHQCARNVSDDVTAGVSERAWAGETR